MAIEIVDTTEFKSITAWQKYDAWLIAIALIPLTALLDKIFLRLYFYMNRPGTLALTIMSAFRSKKMPQLKRAELREP